MKSDPHALNQAVLGRICGRRQGSGRPLDVDHDTGRGTQGKSLERSRRLGELQGNTLGVAAINQLDLLQAQRRSCRSWRACRSLGKSGDRPTAHPNQQEGDPSSVQISSCLCHPFSHRADGAQRPVTCFPVVKVWSVRLGPEIMIRKPCSIRFSTSRGLANTAHGTPNS